MKRFGLRIVGVCFWTIVICQTLAVSRAQTIRYAPSDDAPIAYDAATGRYEEGASFDPLFCSEVSCVELLHNIFEPLVSTSQDRVIEPVLAVGWERLDDVTYRFFLRHNVVFHNGEQFDAQSVRFSLLAASETYGRTAWMTPITRVDIVDSHTVDVVLAEADSLFLYRLNHLGLIRPPKYIRRYGPKKFAAKPVGTGPFRFVQWDSELREIRMASNDKYWREGYPKIDSLIYAYTSKQAALDQLIGGELDLIRRMNPRRTTQFMRTDTGSIVKAWLPQLMFGLFNLTDPGTPLKDLKVRQAINLSINREHLVRYGMIGNARLLAGYTVPEDPNHTALEPYRYDPERARQLLADAGYPDGFKIHLMVSDLASPQIENIIVRSLREIGIDVELKRTKLGEWLAAVFLPKLGEKSSPPFDIIWINIPLETIYHAGIVPMTFLYSRKLNYSTIRDSTVDDLYERAIATYDEAQASELWKQLERYVYDNHLFVTGYQELAVFGARKGLHFTPRALMNFEDAYYENNEE